MPAIATLADLSNSFVYSAIAVYGLAMLGFAADVAGRRPRISPPTTTTASADTLVMTGQGGPPAMPPTPPASPVIQGATRDAIARVSVALTVLAVLLHLAGVVVRAAAAGRVPWGNMYEFALTGSLAAGLAYLAFLRRQPVRDLGAWIVAVLLLTLGLSITVLYVPPDDLVPALNSYWLVIHVAAAVTAGGIFTVGALSGALYLLRLRGDRRRTAGQPVGGYTAGLPAAAALDRASHIAHLFAFPIWTFAVIAGAIWAETSWGRYWGWDPKETWAFITWVLYAAYLHAQSTAGWRGRRATWLMLAGYTAFVFNFFGVNMWISGLHSYAGI